MRGITICCVGTKQELELAQAAFRDRHSEELVLVPLHNALKYLGTDHGRDDHRRYSVGDIRDVLYRQVKRK